MCHSHHYAAKQFDTDLYGMVTALVVQP